MNNFNYSYLNASIGLRRAAWRAGQRPKPIPTTIENIVANRTEKTETFVAQPAKIDKSTAIPTPNIIPMLKLNQGNK